MFTLLSLSLKLIILQLQVMEHSKNDLEYLEELPKANPIRNKTAIPPKSIFPFLPLPHFRYADQENELGPSFCIRQQKQMHVLNETSLSKMFHTPLYQSSNRFNLLADNLKFACLRAFYSECKTHPPIQLKQESSEQKLRFESRFQSGNLAFAVKGEGQCEYNLLLQKDINTTRCTQWFFFRVHNNKLKGKVTFNILNLLKNYSAYENGMKINICSQSNDYTWTRGGTQIKYIKNNIKTVGEKTYYTLSFSFNFEHSDDITYFAHSPPYTFTMMDSFLLKLTNNPDYNSILRRKTLTESPCGNYVDMVTITNFKNKKDKKVAFITARVHPGQSPSSFVCNGIINFLLTNSEQAKKLRDQFVFKIVPMLNPDGVIHGNYRCSLSGYDLNRVWHYDNKFSSPQIYYTKRAIIEQKKCFLYIDLHAHSKKKGVFMYGCQNKSSPYITRHIPYLFWKQINYFNYYQCNFGMKLGRQGTSRLTVHRLLNLPYSYTMEHSFCSPIKQKYHFTSKHYKLIGKQLCLTLKKYFCVKQDLVQQVFKQLCNNKELGLVGAGQEDESSEDSDLDQPIQFKQLMQKQPKVFRRKQSTTFRSKAVDISLQSIKKILSTKPHDISPRKSAFEVDRIQSFLSRNAGDRSKRSFFDTSYETSPHKQNQVKGEQVFLSSRVHKVQKQPQVQRLSQTQNLILRSSSRYQFQDMQSLNNLFLPSLTSASYKRYAKKKTQPIHFIQVGRKYLEQNGILKEQIRSVSRKKPGWKDQILSYL